MKGIRRYLLPFTVACLYLFLYLPIFVLVIYSFNNNALNYQWEGFTFAWYKGLFQSTEIFSAFQNSFFISSSTVFLSLAIGSVLVFFGRRQYIRNLLSLFYGSLAVPEIVLAVGMLSFFSVIAASLGATTLIVGHTLLGLGYVVPILYARFSELDVSLFEASYDLGATQRQTFFAIVLPLLSPALIAAGLLVFIISLDNFIISFFCAGATIQTLPLYIFSMIRSGATPMVNALSTVLLIASSLLVLLFSALQIKKMGIQR